ncbi:prephenate dehydrogenase/arogenate dehydrogenase family protein, partial [bacterium]|nr:prephenate dehydrogenase/arogenate dehydrogenase family protein [bacterium]
DTTENLEVKWDKITIVGAGLLGGSLGMALRERQLADRVVAYVRREASIEECERQGAADLATCDLLSAVRDAQMVILCTPIARMRPLLSRALPAIAPGTIITDVGSVKGPLARHLEPLASKAAAHYIGSHPMAGSEKTGVFAAKPDLFDNAVCAITPTRKTDPGALNAVVQFWTKLGCKPIELTPGVHDVLVSRASHLPHVLAATLAGLVLEPGSRPELRLLCATGFRDTTRIASGSPEMWRDIVLSNRKAITKALDDFEARLSQFRRLLGDSDGDALLNFLADAKEKRDTWAGRAQRPTSME